MENPSHCDFVKLRTILIRTHMHDLKDITGDCHYENYRAQCIQNMARSVCVCVCFLTLYKQKVEQFCWALHLQRTV